MWIQQGGNWYFGEIEVSLDLENPGKTQNSKI